MSSASAVSVVVGGRQLTIEPARVRDLAAFVAAVAPIASDLAAGEMLEALSRHTDRLIDATAIGAGVERAWLDERGADDLVELAAAVMEVNGDFLRAGCCRRSSGRRRAWRGRHRGRHR